MMSEWYAEVERTTTTKGPGVLRLYKDEDLVGEWKVITGGKETDPKVYGGLTPPLEWVMIEPIASRKHPQGHKMEMARIIPFGSDKSHFPKRTFSIHHWPFMLHVAGTSTGCIAVARKDWVACKKALNEAFAESTFPIYVFDELPEEGFLGSMEEDGSL